MTETKETSTGAFKPAVLNVIDTGGPGGAETIFAQLAYGLGQREFRSIPIVSRNAWLFNHLETLGLSPQVLSSKGSFQFPYLNGLRRLIKEENAACVLAHLYGAGLYGAMAAYLAGIPAIVVLHGQSDIAGTQRLASIKHFILRRCATRVVFVSDALRKEIQPKLHLDDNQCVVIPNGVDLRRFPASISRSPSERKITIGSVGNIRKPKAYDVLLKAARIVVDSYPDVEFRIAGEGNGALLDELMQLREALALCEHVTFLGSSDDIPSFLRSLDIFTLSSTTEGFSLALVEAMATGLPVVATRSGGPETIIDSEDCGLLVPTEDPEKLAAALLGLIRNPAKRIQMGLAARKRVESEYSIDKMTAAYQNLIQSSLN